MTKTPLFRRRFNNLLLFPIAIMMGVFVLLYIFPLLFTYWPPLFIERHQQRDQVLQRVKSAGGWDALRRDCIALAGQYKDTGFQSHWLETNGLPQSIIILKPMFVQSYPVTGLNANVVSIRIFGAHATGGHSTPYFGLEVAVGPDRERFRPNAQIVASGNAHSSYTKVADDIYEVY